MINLRIQRGFSLIELLLAIMILAIGIISIAALFPAGISQQQKAADDIIGNVVAQNALAIIRSRISQDDFGNASEFDNRWSSWLCNPGPTQSEINPWPTVCGDWMWRRPAIVPQDFGTGQGAQYELLQGAIDIFGTQYTGVVPGMSPPLAEFWNQYDYSHYDPIIPNPGIPYNLAKYPPLDTDDPPDGVNDDPNIPRILIFAGERQYPMWSGTDPEERPKAQYYWDCMFRRYQGQILVAVFVYRVVSPEGGGAYTVDTSVLNVPDLPRRINLQSANEASTGSWPNGDTAVDPSLRELLQSENDDPADSNNQWQIPGQWIVDQNGSIHHVKRGRRRSGDANVVLTSKPLELPIFSGGFDDGGTGININWWDKTVPFSNGNGDLMDVVHGYGIVTDIWFIPTEDSNGNTLVPVYAMVQEL
ncbi:MAG: prepilin-type N-terminal cleavage/methylation domain-containing protein [Planctomycetes bacterium]|nr:prepilin-type N-terminal cleavage/methylation domain-containing protein [Planctomycetota bacterium]